MDDGNRWKVRLVFDDIEGVRENGMGQNVKIGAEFQNSYNSSSSASGNGYFLRISCTNQMTLKNLIHEISFSRIHFGSSPKDLLDDALVGAENFINGVDSFSNPLAHIIEGAQESKISFASDQEAIDTFVKLFGTKVAGTAIAEAIHPAIACGAEVSRWEIYNAATDYASHAPKVSIDIADNILGIAERRVLNIKNPIEIISMLLTPAAVA
jgi:hypothetical protein